MIVRKPTILIYTSDPDETILKEICAGIEEEGLFFEQVEKDFCEIRALAWQAANDSMLGSGIAVCQYQVALQMRGVPQEKPVQFYKMPELAQCRNLGTNSARAIKKVALKMQEGEEIQ